MARDFKRKQNTKRYMADRRLPPAFSSARWKEPEVLPPRESLDAYVARGGAVNRVAPGVAGQTELVEDAANTAANRGGGSRLPPMDPQWNVTIAAPRIDPTWGF